MFPAPYPYLLLLVPAAVLARDDFRTRRVDASWLAVLGTVSVGGELAHARLADDVAANGRQCRAAPFIGNGSLRLPLPAAARGQTLRRLRRCPLPACRRTPVRTDGVSVVSDRRLRRRLLLWWVCCGRRRRTIPSSVQPALCSSAGPLFNSSAYGCNPDTYPHGDPPPAHGAGGRRVPPRAIRTRGGQDTLLRRDGT